MKKFFSLAAAVAILAGFLVTAWGQNKQGRSSPTPDSVPHRIGLIDIGRVFGENDKAKNLRADLEADMKQRQRRAQTMAQQIKNLQEKKASGTFTAESQEYIQLENEIDKLTAQLQAYSNGMKRDYIRQNAQNLRTVYFEVRDLVGRFAEHYDYTLILVFESGKDENFKKLSENVRISRQLGRRVLYYRERDDITESVIRYLNDDYSKNTNARGNSKTRTK